MDQMRFFRHVSFSTGELTRLRQILRPSGTTFILPYDQFVEHDGRHQEAKSDASNPNYIIELGLDSGCNAVVFHYGISSRFWSKAEGKIPLIVKINGKSSIPSEKQALSVHTSWVEDAVKLGAIGVGYTMYYGSPRQDVDLPQLAAVRKECERYGMPLIVWAYPRGEAIEEKGGRDTSYALESAARLAMEIGATVIKSNLPVAAKPEYLTNEKIPKYYRETEKWLQTLAPHEQKVERAKRIVKIVQGIPILFSGGAEKSDADLMDNAYADVEAGCFGFIYGRNIWKREKGKALETIKQLVALLDKSADQPLTVGNK
jgi:class I fructose-bisphosphate aldolase